MKILTKLGCPSKFVNVVRHLHVEINADVISEGKNQKALLCMQREVKQGCALAPTLFALFLAAMLNEMNG